MSEKTLERYRNLGAYAIVRFGDIRLDRLEPVVIQQAINALHDAGGRTTREQPRGRPLAAKTVRHIDYLVYGCLQTAVLWGKITTNPMDRVEFADSDDVDQSFRGDGDQRGAKRREAFSV